MIPYTDIKSKIKNTQDQIVEELSNFTIPCPICGQPFHRVAQHAKTAHGILIPTFKEIFVYTTAAGALAQKIKQLYAPKSDTYIEQYSYCINGVWYVDYRTIEAEKVIWGKYLTQKSLIAHLRGTKTYGGIFYPSASKVLVFDIDCDFESVGIVRNPCSDPWIKSFTRRYAAEPTYWLSLALEENGVPPQCIHILHSGKKGFHIDLYFENWVSIDKLTAFGKFIIDQTYGMQIESCGPESQWEEDYVTYTVELRPESRSSRGVRFPLGIHRETGEVMVYCQKEAKDFPAVSDQYSYLLYETKKINEEIFSLDIYPNVRRTISHGTVYTIPKNSYIPGAAPTARRQEDKSSILRFARGHVYNELTTNIGRGANNHRKSRHYTPEELSDFLVSGLRQHGTRHNVTVGLAILLKEKGFTKTETYNELINWSKEKLNGNSKTPQERIKRDVGKIVYYTYLYDYHLDTQADTQWLLTDTDVMIIATYHFLSINEQITLAVIFMIRRLFGPDAYQPQQLIAKITGFTARTVRNHIKKFISLGILKLTYRGNSYQKTSNKYEVIDFQEEYLHALSFSYKKIDGKAFVKGLKKFATEKFIKARYPWYIKTVKIYPVRMKGFKLVNHPEIPSKENSLPETEPTDNTKEKIDGRKIFESKIFVSVIAIFNWLRKMKKKHGAKWAKIFPSWRGFYMKC